MTAAHSDPQPATAAPSRRAAAFLLLPVFLSFYLLGAHFLHAGNAVLAGLCVMLPLGPVLVRQRWMARAIQVLLVLAAVEWLLSIPITIARVQMRGHSPMPTVIILGSVAAFTALSALVFQTRTLRRRFP